MRERRVVVWSRRGGDAAGEPTHAACAAAKLGWWCCRGLLRQQLREMSTAKARLQLQPSCPCGKRSVVSMLGCGGGRGGIGRRVGSAALARAAKGPRSSGWGAWCVQRLCYGGLGRRVWPSNNPPLALPSTWQGMGTLIMACMQGGRRRRRMRRRSGRAERTCGARCGAAWCCGSWGCGGGRGCGATVVGGGCL